MGSVKKINIKNLKKKTIISLLLGILVIIIGVIVIVNILLARKELNTKTYKDEELYLYFSLEKFDFKGNITLNHDKDITEIQFNHKKTKLFSEPVYYASGKGLILPVNYSIIFPMSAGRQNRLNYYTELLNIDDDYYLVGNQLNFNMNHNFLFDGSDMYIFVDDAVVSFGDVKIPITPMSYVQYLFDSKELFIYNYEEDKVYYYDSVRNDVLVSNEYYSVNLSGDIIKVNGKDKLLMKNFDYLKKLK